MTERHANSGGVAAEVVADLQFRRQVEHLHRLGARALAELLAELAAECSIMTVINQKLAAYVEIEPEVLEAADGARFWPAPLYEAQPSPEPPGCSGKRAITRDSTA